VFKRWLGRDEPTEAAEAQIEASLTKTRLGLRERLSGLFGPVDITEATWEELEDRLIQSDVGAATAAALVADLREAARRVGVRRASELPPLLQAVMVRALELEAPPVAAEGPRPRPFVTLVVGVNGSGKTTTIAKLAWRCRTGGRTVVLVAADTFRAAAIEQLQVWATRADVPVMAGQPGGDAAAVVFDALSSAAGRDADEVIIDTAGRLHTQSNLMAELEKVRRVVSRAVPGAPHETLLVLDATTGQNGLVQARAFTAAVAVTGLVLAKLDSTAKGGVAFAVTRELGVPIRYVGTGEQLADLAPFDPAAYAAGVVGLAGAGPPSPSTGAETHGRCEAMMEEATAALRELDDRLQGLLARL
jgi:fused signal recognition particle receptor